MPWPFSRPRPPAASQIPAILNDQQQERINTLRHGLRDAHRTIERQLVEIADLRAGLREAKASLAPFVQRTRGARGRFVRAK